MAALAATYESPSHDIAEAATISKLSDQELVAEFLAAIRQSAVHIRRAALVYDAAVKRGIDMRKYRSALTAYFPAVAQGRLLPEALELLIGNEVALKGIASLSLKEQHEVISAGHIVVRTANGDARVALPDIREQHVRTAIDHRSGRVLPVADQTPPVHRTPPKTGSVRLPLTLSAAEHDKITLAAASAGLTPQRYVHDLLKLAGAI